MQNYKKFIYDRLKNDSSIQGYVDDRIYPLHIVRPTNNRELQDVIIYNRISDTANRASVRV